MKKREFHYVYSFPVQNEPEWSSSVERWYQLDAAAYGLAQIYWQYRSELSEQPDFLILASPGASNQTDYQFAHTGAMSPAKFVHTLPSVRGTSLLQIMNWKGPLLCLQRDPETWLMGLEEAESLLSIERRRIWVVMASCQGEQYKASLAELQYVENLHHLI